MHISAKTALLTCRLITILALFMTPSIAVSGDYDEGMAAYYSKDYEAAHKFLKNAAEGGEERAQFTLAGMYAQGLVGFPDWREAVKWYERSADQGNTFSMYLIATAYYQGNGVTQNFSLAARWAKRAAFGDVPVAQNMLSFMYYFGRGVPVNKTKALQWSILAARLGNEEYRETRELMSKGLSPAQITNAQSLAAKCLDTKYKFCD